MEPSQFFEQLDEMREEAWDRSRRERLAIASEIHPVKIPEPKLLGHKEPGEPLYNDPMIRQWVYDLRDKGKTFAQIAGIVCISTATVSRILNPPKEPGGFKEWEL